MILAGIVKKLFRIYPLADDSAHTVSTPKQDTLRKVAIHSLASAPPGVAATPPDPFLLEQLRASGFHDDQIAQVSGLIAAQKKVAKQNEHKESPEQQDKGQQEKKHEEKADGDKTQKTTQSEPDPYIPTTPIEVLLDAICKMDIKTVKRCLHEHKGLANEVTEIEEGEPLTPLIVLCRIFSLAKTNPEECSLLLKIAVLLIEYGADVNKKLKTVHGWTSPLKISCRELCPELAGFLLDNGADVEVTELNDHFPLFKSDRLTTEATDGITYQEEELSFVTIIAAMLIEKKGLNEDCQGPVRDWWEWAKQCNYHKPGDKRSQTSLHISLLEYSRHRHVQESIYFYRVNRINKTHVDLELEEKVTLKDLFAAIERADLIAVRIILQKKPELAQTCEEKTGRTVANAVCESYADIAAKDDINPIEKKHLANNLLKILSLLVKNGADLNREQPAQNGQPAKSPLLIACLTLQSRLVHFLTAFSVRTEVRKRERGKVRIKGHAIKTRTVKKYFVIKPLIDVRCIKNLNHYLPVYIDRNGMFCGKNYKIAHHFDLLVIANILTKNRNIGFSSSSDDLYWRDWASVCKLVGENGKVNYIDLCNSNTPEVELIFKRYEALQKFEIFEWGLRKSDEQLLKKQKAANDQLRDIHYQKYKQLNYVYILIKAFYVYQFGPSSLLSHLDWFPAIYTPLLFLYNKVYWKEQLDKNLDQYKPKTIASHYQNFMTEAQKKSELDKIKRYKALNYKDSNIIGAKLFTIYQVFSLVRSAEPRFFTAGNARFSTIIFFMFSLKTYLVKNYLEQQEIKIKQRPLYDQPKLAASAVIDQAETKKASEKLPDIQQYFSQKARQFETDLKLTILQWTRKSGEKAAAVFLLTAFLYDSILGARMCSLGFRTFYFDAATLALAYCFARRTESKLAKEQTDLATSLTTQNKTAIASSNKTAPGTEAAASAETGAGAANVQAPKL